MYSHVLAGVAWEYKLYQKSKHILNYTIKKIKSAMCNAARRCMSTNYQHFCIKKNYI